MLAEKNYDSTKKENFGRKCFGPEKKLVNNFFWPKTASYVLWKRSKSNGTGETTAYCIKAGAELCQAQDKLR